jgi:hypothetical protein
VNTGERETELHGSRPGGNCEARQAIGACMITIGNQSRAVNFPARSGPDQRCRFVRERPDKSRNRDCAERVNRAGRDQATQRLAAGSQCADQNCNHHRNAGEIFHPPITVCESSGRLPAHQKKSYRQRDRGRRVGCVVNRICQQGNAAGA